MLSAGPRVSYEPENTEPSSVLCELATDLEQLNAALARAHPDTAGLWQTAACELLKQLQTVEFQRWLAQQEKDDVFGGAQSLENVIARLRAYQPVVVSHHGDFHKFLQQLALVLEALHAVNSEYGQEYNQLFLGLQRNHTMEPDHEINEGDPLMLNLLAFLHVYSRLCRELRGLDRWLEPVVNTGPTVAGPVPEEEEPPRKKKKTTRQGTTTVTSLVVKGARARYHHFEHVIQGLLTSKTLAQLRRVVQDVQTSVALPQLSDHELPGQWRESVQKSHAVYSALYVVSVCLQAAAAALEGPVGDSQRRNILTVVLEPITALHHQIIDAGLPSAARQRWLAVLYQYARLWATLPFTNTAVLDFFSLALPALTVALCPVLVAPQTRARDAFLLQGANGARTPGLTAYPLLPTMNRRQKPHFYSYCISRGSGERRLSESEAIALRLLRDKGSGQLYLPLTVAPATFYHWTGNQSSPVNYVADALWRWSQLSLLDADTSAEVAGSVRQLLSQHAQPTIKVCGQRVGAPIEVSTIATTVPHDPTTCYSRLYANELGFQLRGKEGQLKGALPGKWRRASGQPGTTYLQREQNLFCVYPVQTLRSAAEKQQAREQTSGPCICRADGCKRRLVQALQEQRSVEIRFSLLSAPVYWKKLEPVEITACNQDGSAELFALGICRQPPQEAGGAEPCAVGLEEA